MQSSSGKLPFAAAAALPSGSRHIGWYPAFCGQAGVRSTNWLAAAARGTRAATQAGAGSIHARCPSKIVGAQVRRHGALLALQDL
jgi:hypothetical protein